MWRESHLALSADLRGDSLCCLDIFTLFTSSRLFSIFLSRSEPPFLFSASVITVDSILTLLHTPRLSSSRSLLSSTW